MSFRGAASIVGLLLVLFLGWAGFKWLNSTWIPAGYVGVMYSARGGLEHKVYPPRRVYVPWLHQLYTYPTLTKAAVYTQDTEVGEDKSADGIQVTTNDNAQTTFDVIVYYHVNPTDVFTVFKTFGAIDIDDIQKLHIRRAVKDAAQVAGTECDAFSLMGKKRQDASAVLTTELQKRLSIKGITVERAFFGQAYPAQQLQAKVTRQINSLTNITIANINQQKADVEKSIAITKAKAENQATMISSAQTQVRSLQMLQLQADQAAIAKWDGHLPAMHSRTGQQMFVNAGAFNTWLDSAAKQKAEQPAKPAAPTDQPAQSTDDQGDQ